MKYSSEGFLLSFNKWNHLIARQISKKENIILYADHWFVIRVLRRYYYYSHSSPAIRLLIKIIMLHSSNKKWNSLYLQELFPSSPAVQSSKIAGLPKPDRCI